MARQLRSGKDLVRRKLVICGTVDLGGAEVRGLFECRNCVFLGALDAAEADFGGTVDLSGTRIAGAVQLGGTRFHRPALFDMSAAQSTTFDKATSLRLARFDDVASFAGAQFKKRSDFGLAHFAGDALFDQAQFAATSFADTRFDGRASFTGDQTVFSGPADFRSATFAGRVDFYQAEFDSEASFEGASFSAPAGFVGVDFQDARFDNVRAGDLDFTGVTADFLSFSEVVAQSLSLRDAFVSRQGIVLDHVAINDLVLAVDKASYVQGDRGKALELIEQSAKNRGDLSTANNAHYQRQIVASKGYCTPVYLLDLVFYRWIAGYLVRPWQPLAVLAVLFLAAWIVRQVKRARQAHTGRPAGWKLTRARWVASRSGNALFDTMSIAVRGADTGAGSTGEGLLFLRRLEVLAYRLLLVCVLIGLANSNPTLRQVLDALHI